MIVNDVVEAVMELIDEMELFARIRRGALGSGAGITCEVGPSFTEERYLDKNSLITLDLTLNAKHTNLETVSRALDQISDTLIRRTAYPAGQGWEIVDITHGSTPLPTVIGREDSGEWLMASDISIKYYRKDDDDE